jgi:hypothetical protein
MADANILAIGKAAFGERQSSWYMISNSRSGWQVDLDDTNVALANEYLIIYVCLEREFYP